MGFFDRFRKKDNSSRELKNALEKVNMLAFPGGSAQQEKEINEVHELLRDKISSDEAKYLLIRTKSLLVIAQDKSEDRIASSIFHAADGKLTLEDAKVLYHHLVGDTTVQVPDGDGSTMETAVIINASSPMFAVPAQYTWLESRYGKEGVDWTPGGRFYMSGENGENYTVHEIELKNGESRRVYFDITASLGNF